MRPLVVLCATVLLALGVAPAQAFAEARPGDVVSAEPATFYLDPARLTRANADAWRIVYRSTSATGAANEVSGTVLVPRMPYIGLRPIVAYAVGTHGLGDQCAPSRQMAAGTEVEGSLINNLLLQGWAVVVTDYEGLGTPGLHTYLVGISQGRAVLDSVRAAQRLPAAGLSDDAPVAVWGYSQGGASAGWAAQLHASYAPELRLRGVAAGGVPADLIKVARALDGGAFFAFLGAAAIGFDTAYPALDLAAYLNDAGKAAIADARDDCTREAVPKFAFRRMSDFTTTDVLARADWRARLGENRLGGRASPEMPLFLYHAVADEVIPYGVGRTLRQEYCAAGARVLWRDFLVAEHVLGAAEAAPAVTEWLWGRFAGLPAPSTC